MTSRTKAAVVQHMDRRRFRLWLQDLQEQIRSGQLLRRVSVAFCVVMAHARRIAVYLYFEARRLGTIARHRLLAWCAEQGGKGLRFLLSWFAEQRGRWLRFLSWCMEQGGKGLRFLLSWFSEQGGRWLRFLSWCVEQGGKGLRFLLFWFAEQGRRWLRFLLSWFAEQGEKWLRFLSWCVEQSGKRLRLLAHTWSRFALQAKALCLLLWARARQWLVVARGYWPAVRYRMQQYGLLMRLDKPVGIFLLLWPALWGLWIAAGGMPDPDILMIFLCGVFLMRSSGVVLNDIADRNIDRMVRRTRGRPLACRNVNPLEALMLACVLLFLALLLVLQLNYLSQCLAVVALLLAASYPWMKRVSYLPQFYLGLCFGWSIPMAFAAQTGDVPRIAWVLMLTNLLWTVVYDTFYAMMDREDDVGAGVKSTAILFGDLDREILFIVLLLVNLGFFLVARGAELGFWFYLALAGCAMINLYQFRLLSKRGSEDYMKAFRSNNAYGGLIFMGIFASYAA